LEVSRSNGGNPIFGIGRSAPAEKRACVVPGNLFASEPMPPASSLWEIFLTALRLGCTSFGGPVAHLGYFHKEYVERRRWLDDARFADLVALCQFLPGPASSQVIFAVGMHRAGPAGALLSTLGFTLPSAVLMILFGYSVTVLGDLRGAGWLHGLKLAAVAVVAQAVWTMGRRLCPDRTRVTLALLVAAGVLIAPRAYAQIGAIALGALAGWWLYRREIGPGEPATGPASRSHAWAAATLLGFALLLLGLPVLAAACGRKDIAIFDAFYRAGSLVFGGGHVILPLLRTEVVPPGWVSDDAFLAGYGLAQAVPGPLFTFAGYLGTVMHTGPFAWVGGVWCLLAIFLPAGMLIGGALPFWHLFRSRAWAQAALRGANAAVVGVLLAALYRPVWTSAVVDARSAALAVAAFAALQVWKSPPWAVVLAAAGLGQLFL
jgi:chromate transporter